MTVHHSQPKDNFLPKYYPAGKLHKKCSFVWRLLMVMLVGLCGLSLCFVRVGQRSIFTKAAFFGKHAIWSSQCPHPSSNSMEGVLLHYPRPISFYRSECTCTPVQFFVILSMQRSGSGWFETLLNDHPSINSHGEIFSGGERHSSLRLITRTLDKVYNLDYKSSAIKDECTSAVGFKWMLNQGVMEYSMQINQYFRSRGVSVIFLFRRNLLRRLVSILANAYDKEVKLLNGTHKSHVHSKEEADTLATFKPIVNNEFLPASFQRIVEFTQNALEAFNNTRHMVVYYEDLVKSPKILDQVQEFLGVPVVILKSQQVKIHTQSLADQIQNWDAVYKTLMGSEFEEFLNQTEYA